MVSPRLISSNSIEKLIVHELVHVLHGQINPDAPFWMIEGIAMYEAGQYESVSETVSNGIQANCIPTLTSMDILKNEEAFTQAGGYDYAYSVVEFAVLTFGEEILSEWVKTPRDYERVFGVIQEIFEKQWKKWLMERYT